MKRLVNHLSVRSRQAYRYGRLGGNLIAGSAFISSCYRFPSISKINDCHLGDYRLFARWVEDLAYSMNTELHVSGERLKESGFFVSNHISWLDTILLSYIQPISFIARHDLEFWPLLGTFTKRMQSVYVDRSNKFQAYRSIPALEARLRQGRSVHVFPESTTSDGSKLLPFYPMFYEAAVRTDSMVQAVAIKYTDEYGRHLVEPAFINDDSFLTTLERILKVEKVHAHYHFLPAMSAKKYTRKELCQLTKNQIETYLF